MNFQLQMGPGYERTVADMGAMGRSVVEAVAAGLQKGGKIAAANVIENYLTGQALKRRSGGLARAVDSWPVTDTDVVIGVREGAAVDRYKWLLGDESKTIVPKNSRFLTIPIGEGLTAAGVPRYSSPRDVQDGFIVKTKGRLLFGYKRGKKGKFRPLFILVKSVFIQGSGALYDGVLESIDDIGLAIEAELDKRTGAA